ncbi:MAG: sigma-54 dependent transcriptional regulator [Acidobacteriota bacterium]|nr:sigma-54 dependent transcriptional regulator [Acidobacteriota bacterium]
MKKHHVAIVDDDSAFGAYLKTFLSLRGYEARTYGRGDEFLASVRNAEQPDVVLLDVMMPGMDGVETLKSLRASLPDLPVIMLSGNSETATVVKAMQAGATDFIEKPDSPEALGEIRLEVVLKNALERKRLTSELSELRRQLSDDEDQAMWGASEKMQIVAQVIDQVSDSDVGVLIRGESGVGKELVTRAIHQRSTRKSQPFVKVNCAALPPDLLESELFGHEKGAFTGAATTRIGKFEQADGGTMFLDEIGEMKPALQSKLLHVLQDAEFTKLGSNRPVNVDVRVIAATNRDLEQMMLRGDFREDLYYRLKVIEVHVPPLRERRDEIPFLIDFFLSKYASKWKKPVPRLSEMLQAMLLAYHWPGNIRELENMIKQVVVLQDERMVMKEIERQQQRAQGVAVMAGASIGAVMPMGMPSTLPTSSLPTTPAPPPVADAGTEEDEEAVDDTAPVAAEGGTSLSEVARAASLKAERALIEQTLQQVQWNRRKAAELLGVSYKTLLNKIKECGISR